MNAERIVYAHDLYAAYHPPGQNKIWALKGSDLTLYTGEIVGLLGRNGAGKTTLIRVLLGLMHRAKGELEVAGLDPQTQRSEILRRVGAVLNGRRLLRDRWTPVDTFAYLGAATGIGVGEGVKRGLRLLERFGIAESSRMQLMRFSLGMKQKMVLAIAMLNDPELLVLDEPTIGLDVESVRELSRLIYEAKDEGRSVIVTSHQLNLLERLSDRVVVIHDGVTVFEGTVEALKSKAQGQKLVVSFREEINENLTALHPWVEQQTPTSVAIPMEPKLIAELMRVACENNWDLSAVEQTASFEDAFLDLVSGNEENELL